MASILLSKSITDRYKINGKRMPQPDKDMTCNFETTYSEGSNRTQFGKAILVPLFTVVQYGYEASNIPVAEAEELINAIIHGKPFNLYHYSIRHHDWRTESFYVGKGTFSLACVAPGEEYYSKISCNMQGVNQLD